MQNQASTAFSPVPTLTVTAPGFANFLDDEARRAAASATFDVGTHSRDRLTRDEATQHRAEQLDDAILTAVRQRRVAILFGENRATLLRYLTNGILDHLAEFGELDKLVTASLEGNAVDLGTVINHVMVNDALADLGEDQDETPKAMTLFQRMLDDHQRASPHHADQCEICRDAAKVLR